MSPDPPEHTHTDRTGPDTPGVEVMGAHPPGVTPPEGSVGLEGVPPWLPQTLMIFGVVMITWMMLRMLWRRRRRQGLEDRGSPSERLAELHRRADQRAVVDSFLADAQELTERLASQLDAKAARIEKLLEDADGAIRRLEGVRRDGVDRSANGRPEAHADPMTRRVYELSDEGREPVQIARELNQPIGQVELILALRRG
jgi:hypothetical protein